jgi:integration host factor subunit beta
LPGIAVQPNEGTCIMTKSDLIEVLAAKPDHQLHYQDVELAVRYIVECMSNSLASGERIEVRGFGSFSLHFRPPRVGRNPKTGDAVALAGKHVPHFKPGKELRDRVNDAYQLELAAAGSA